jgi:hypothetical protein
MDYRQEYEMLVRNIHKLLPRNTDSMAQRIADLMPYGKNKEERSRALDQTIAVMESFEDVFNLNQYDDKGKAVIRESLLSAAGRLKPTE